VDIVNPPDNVHEASD